MKLPKEVWSQLGPIPVHGVKTPHHLGKEDDDAFGVWNHVKRHIEIENEQAALATQIATLFHEMVHVALWDSGVRLNSDEAEEAICDAVGTYLAGATLAGYLKLQVPK